MFAEISSNIRRSRLNDAAVFALSSLWRLELEIRNTLHFNLVWPGVAHCAIRCHVDTH